MRNDIKTRFLPLVALGVIFLAAPPGTARCLDQQQQQPDAQQPGPVDDPIRELYLTAEQREKIRAIREQTREERAAINQRLRDTRGALEEALDADNPDEALVEQRLRDVAAAQAAQMRMRVLTEVRIRRVLTPEQQRLLRTLRQAKELRRDRPIENQRRQADGLNGSRPLPNQRNGLGPLFPRRADSPRRPRP